MHIRESKPEELKEISELHFSAFGEKEGCQIVKLIEEFHNEETPFLSLIMESDQNIIGHIIFSDVKCGESELKGTILAPLAVLPQYQKQGVGRKLIEWGISKLKESQTQFVFVYGDPTYYSKFGFSAEQSELFIPPYKLQYPLGWQLKILNPIPLPNPPLNLSCAKPLMKPELW